MDSLLHRLLRICSLRSAAVYDSAAVKSLALRTASLPSDHRNWCIYPASRIVVPTLPLQRYMCRISEAAVIIGRAGGRRQISFEMLSPIRSMQIA